MKFVIVLSALICCAYAQSSTQAVATPLRDQLERRAAVLDARVKIEVKRLETEKREHLAQLLQEEGKRLETLSNDLKVVSVNDVVRLAVLEDQLIIMEYRVENEINILQRERATQELLLSNARILREWTNEEIKRLEATEGAHREQAHQVARELRRAEVRLGEIAQELVKAQDQMSVERFEVELRAIEARLYEALRALHFNPSTGTPGPATGSTRPVTQRSTTITTQQPTTRITRVPSSTTVKTSTTTAKHLLNTAKLTPSTVGSTLNVKPTRSSTNNPLTELHKEKLIERAKQLVSDAEKEIKILTEKGNINNAYELKIEKNNLQDLVIQLGITSETDLKQIKSIEQEVVLAENKLKETINKYEAHLLYIK